MYKYTATQKISHQTHPISQTRQRCLRFLDNFSIRSQKLMTSSITISISKPPGMLGPVMVGQPPCSKKPTGRTGPEVILMQQSNSKSRSSMLTKNARNPTFEKSGNFKPNNFGLVTYFATFVQIMSFSPIEAPNTCILS